MKFIWLNILNIILLLGMTSCDNSDPVIPHQEELITTFIFQLTSSDGSHSAEYTYSDIDGPGGNDPITSDALMLKPNTTYNGKVTLFNESVDPVIDVSEEVEEEADEHQLFYLETPEGLVAIKYLDFDDNANPLGLEIELNTVDSANGNLMVTLLHEPDKFAPGVSEGMIENAEGSTDLQIVVPLVVQ